MQRIEIDYKTSYKQPHPMFSRFLAKVEDDVTGWFIRDFALRDPNTKHGPTTK